MSLMGRTEPLHLHAPADLKPILDAILDVADTVLSFPLLFEPLPDGSEVIAEGYTFKVTCFPVIHRIKCHGFLIETRNRSRRLLPRQCEQFKIPLSFYELLKDGADYEAPDGSIVKNELVTQPAPAPKKYAYCADTIYTESYLPMIENADAIYHEATYLEEDQSKATARYHCTATQAALIAKKANVGLLLLGHFSSKYKDLAQFSTEANSVFANTQVTVEGTAYEI
jgi:ribonuclease Z